MVMYESSGSPEANVEQAVSAVSLRAQAERCRRHARTIADEMASLALEALAAEYESKAAAMDRDKERV
jgi:hypothetical protein